MSKLDSMRSAIGIKAKICEAQDTSKIGKGIIVVKETVLEVKGDSTIDLIPTVNLEDKVSYLLSIHLFFGINLLRNKRITVELFCH